MDRPACISRLLCGPFTERRHWTLPAAEWLRLWAGVSLPLLLIRHAVGTRVGDFVLWLEPSYEKVVVALITTGTQGLQLALLAPGWVHGCLGLWFRVRHYAPMRQREAGACHPARALASAVGLPAFFA